MAEWWNVNKDIRVWAGHSESHKQGWLRAPAAVFIIETYGNAGRFEEAKVEDSGILEYEVSSDYPESWVKMADISKEPFEDEDDVSDELPVVEEGNAPTVPSSAGDAALGAAFRLIVNFILGR